MVREEAHSVAMKLRRNRRSLRSVKVPKGGITALAGRKPRHLTSTDLIEQNKRLNLERQN